MVNLTTYRIKLYRQSYNAMYLLELPRIRQDIVSGSVTFESAYT